MRKCDFCEHECGPLMGQSEICSACRDSSNFQVKKRMNVKQAYEYEKFKKDMEWLCDQNTKFDRATALMVLQAISHRMRPSHNIFGEKTLVINRYDFEVVRKKFLDKKIQKEN